MTMQDLSYHILDIVENSLNAEAGNVRIRIVENTVNDWFKITIKDDGKGIDERNLPKVKDPFFTTRTTRPIGMGISLLEQAARQAGGRMIISSKAGMGSTLTATFKHSHIDRKPLGDIASTLAMLLSSHANVNFIYEHHIDGEDFTFNSKEIKKVFNGFELKSPQALKALKDLIQEKEKELISKKGGADG